MKTQVRAREPEAGERAPGYDGTSHAGEKCGSNQNVGHPTVLLFFLDSSNADCEAELRGFRDLHDSFHQLGARVVAASVDGADVHRALAERLGGVPFPLMPDPDAAAAAAYGVVRPEGDGGQVSLGRRTFVIDPNHRVAKVYAPTGDLAAHAAEVLADVKALFAREEPRRM